MRGIRVAVIMDGNRRWAKGKGLPIMFGHKKGAERFKELLSVAVEQNVAELTVYAWSRDNFKRGESEKTRIFDLMLMSSDGLIEQVKQLNVCVKHIGNIELLPVKVSEVIRKIEDETACNTGMRLVIAAAYSSRHEMAKVIGNIADQVSKGHIAYSDINEDLIGRSLLVKEPDLLIRTSGECRLSDFLLWEIAYTELYFCNKNWPDFAAVDFLEAVDWYKARQRRFGC